jgi:cobaltochelatase CobT
LQTESHAKVELQNRYSALIRSISGDTYLHIRDWQLFRKNLPLNAFAPHLNLIHLQASWAYPRGILDGIALRLRYSDQELHLALSPAGLIESLVFEVLEQIRVESICPKGLKGSKQNIENQFLAWMQEFMSSGGVEGSIGLLLLSIFSTTWVKLNHRPIPQLMQDVVEATRAGLAEVLGPHLVKIKANQFNQAQYAKTSLEIARLVSHLIQDEYQSLVSIRTKQKNMSSSFLKIEWTQPPTQSSNSRNYQHHSLQESKRSLERALEQYKVFNSDYDVEIEAKKRIRPAQLTIYQQQLNEEISKLNIPWGKLSRSYQNIFLSTTNKRWQNSEAEGLLDRRFLTRIATSPLDPIVYKHPSQQIKVLGRVSLLIDCSGSMKEQRIKIAVYVDSLIRILEQAHIQTEVLGYSTSTWQGGRPFKEWRRNGQIPNPGRLNERVHWIFKNFQTNWRRARPGIAALLRPEIYAESIDGEALLWAAGRLISQNRNLSTHNKLILFSDGCPMDRATIEANGENFLKNHLVQAIEWCEQQNNLELWGCGIGEELRQHFPHRLSWDQENGLTSDSLMNWAKELTMTNTRLPTH